MDYFDFDLAGVFSFTVSPLELVFLCPLMNWLLSSVFHFILCRDVGSPGIYDFLRVVVLGNGDRGSNLIRQDQPRAAA